MTEPEGLGRGNGRSPSSETSVWRIEAPSSAGAIASPAGPERASSNKGWLLHPYQDRSAMSNEQVSFRELNAELRAIEERIDRRHAELFGKLEGVIVRSEHVAQSVQNAAAGIVALHTKVEENGRYLASRIDQATQENKNTRWIILGTIVAAGLAMLALVWQTNGLLLEAFALRLEAQQSAPATDPMNMPR
jgi:hypothetical protein